MGQDLKAENLAISIPNNGCDKYCSYCISRMTGYMVPDTSLMLRNAKKVLNLAKAAEVTNVLFTGKGEPMMSTGALCALADIFTEFPLELQTNGIRLASRPELYVPELFYHGFNVIAVSIDTPEQLMNYDKLFNSIASFNMVSRITLNVTDLLKNLTFDDVVNFCILHEVRQLTVRRIVTPQHVTPADQMPVKWIEEHAPESLYVNFMKTVDEKIQGAQPLRILRDGMKVYEIGHNLSFVHSDYCIQEQDKGRNVRSLVFQENGHLYTSWLESAILF